ASSARVVAGGLAPATAHAGAARDRRLCRRHHPACAGRAVGPGMARDAPAGRSQCANHAARFRREVDRARAPGPRAEPSTARHDPVARNQQRPATAPASRADRPAAERRVAHPPLRRHERRGAHRPGLGRRRAHPTPRELATSRARGILVPGHARAGQGAVPDPRIVGGIARSGRGTCERARHVVSGSARHPAPTSVIGATRRPKSGAMIGNLSRRERTLIGAAGGVAVIVLGWVVVVQPIRDANRTASELVPVREQVLTRRQDLVGRKAAIAAELEATNQRLESLSERFLPAGTPAVAASELQKLLKGMAAQASTDVRSESILPPVERGDLLEIPIEIAVSGEIRQLVELLALIDRAPKLLAVQDLKVRVVNITQPKELLATLTLSGFILPGKQRT